MSKLSQKDQVREHLMVYGDITSWEAIMKYHITRLSAVIFDLRAEGLQITSDTVYKTDEEGNKHAEPYVRYTLVGNRGAVRVGQ